MTRFLLLCVEVFCNSKFSESWMIPRYLVNSKISCVFQDILWIIRYPVDSKISFGFQDIISAGYSVEILTSFIGPQECGTNLPEILQIVGYRFILRWAGAKFSNTLDKFKSSDLSSLLVYPEILRICRQLCEDFGLEIFAKEDFLILEDLHVRSVILCFNYYVHNYCSILFKHRILCTDCTFLPDLTIYNNYNILLLGVESLCSAADCLLIIIFEPISHLYVWITQITYRILIKI